MLRVGVEPLTLWSADFCTNHYANTLYVWVVYWDMDDMIWWDMEMWYTECAQEFRDSVLVPLGKTYVVGIDSRKTVC